MGDGVTAIVQTPAERLAETILVHTVELGIVALGISIVVCLYRILRGPTLADRGLASDVIALQVVGLAILLTIRLKMLVFFDAVLIVAILGFASTIAFAQFIGRRRAV
ncbi:MAG: monovalent cation/H+ antiporter complex subunit F [Phycisphaerales bacterium JB043]